MKAFARPVIICVGLAIILSGVLLLKVAAQNNAITPQQIEQIRSGCSPLKNTLNQLHVSDALLRVNMGQRYELMLTKLMDRFNSRVSSNNLNNTGLVFVSGSYNTALDAFRSDYILYEEQMSATINIDCTNQPSEFYDAIVLAQTKRSQVYSDVAKLNNLIDQYESAVNQFEKDYQFIAGKIAD